MKFTLLLICCCLGLSASAQWYRVDLKLKRRLPYQLIEQVPDHSLIRLPVATYQVAKIKLHTIKVTRSDYSIEANEKVVIRSAEHNMRFREYYDASYDFTTLAHLYIEQNRYSEAKWYLLQSNAISRDQSDDRHTIANLIDLAMIKSSIGDYDLSLVDLAEAHDLALQKGLKNDMLAVEKKVAFVKENKLSPPKTDLRYAEDANITEKAD